MRSFTVLSLIIAGAICALTLGWFFFSTNSDEKQFQQQTSISNADTLTRTTEPSEIKPQEVSPPEPALLSSPQPIPFVQSDSDNTNKTSENASDTHSDKTSETTSEIPPQITPKSTPDITPKISIARIDPQGSAVLAGTADARASIIISENGVELGRTVADDSGEWVAVLDKNLAQGEHLLIIEMHTEDGEIILADRAIVAQLMGDDKPLVAIVPMGEAISGERADVRIVSVPEELKQPVTPIITPQTARNTAKDTDQEKQAPKAVPTSVEALEPNISIFTLAWQSSTMLTIKGEAEAGETIRVSFGETQMQADYQQNSWSATIAVPVDTGVNARLTAELFSGDNTILARKSLNIDLRQLDIGKDGSDMVVVQKGDMLWRIAYRTYGSGIRYLDIVKRNQTRIDDPDLIFPTQIFSLPAQ